MYTSLWKVAHKMEFSIEKVALLPVRRRARNEELPETWYDQFIEKYRVSRQYKLSLGDRELDRRTAEGMSSYLRHLEKYKRRRVPFQNDHSNSALDVINSTDSDVFFPETMFTLNSVPEIAVPQIIVEETKQNIEFNGVLDTLPQCMTKSPVMIERLGIRPEYLGMEQEGNSHHGNSALEGNKKCFSEEQASQISQKVIARMLTGGGFEGATEVPLEVLSEMLGSHICKLGRILKVLSDNYRKQCSALELLKMFLQAAGHSNLGILAELIKDGTRNVVQQSQELIKDGSRNIVQQSQELIKDGTRNIVQQNQELVKEGTRNFVQQSPQQVHGAQSQLQSHQQSPVKLPQQVPRQMHQQMQQMVQPQNLAFQQMQQQHLERSRMRQPSTPRPGMDMDKDRSMSQVNAENSSKLPMDANALNASNAKQSQMQFHQQQLNTMSNLQAQSSNQFKQSTPVQIPQMHSPNMGVVRAPPVKVDGFQELMGGDASMKHDSEENKLTSPISK
ncbi:transcription initiation factor TFIID subunit [Citrus sinensis]|uniref:Transcription initiation factor TFIID subunit n=1 Tax=Citrus sinensis TaxID=2711 RepID=A0ACB8J5F4_CITSI|nr:transcription initiation factor TFIID subunit [Citrus sinensis]